MASQAAIALENARLYYDVNKQLMRRLTSLDILVEVGRYSVRVCNRIRQRS